MPKERDETTMNKSKLSLLLSMMQQRFEDNVYGILNDGKYQSMEELDAMLDERLRKYYDECDMVRDYYDKKIYS